MKNSTSKSLDVAIGLGSIILLLAELVAVFHSGFYTGPIRKGPTAILLGIYLNTWGLLFFLSYFFETSSFLFRGLIWVCCNFSSPKGRRMAFFYAGLSITLGTVGILAGAGAW